ncbi:MAG: T9SS type A sorting domain-containing protein [candidate division Zixibacteria bacterium]|nr:T9SS type A sorting domain-containing protein [candidate division Zixibacteria bacterium]
MKRSSAIILVLLLVAVPAILLAADVGNRDVFRVGKAQFISETEFTVTLEVIHDEELAAMDIPLAFSEGVTLTDVTFEGTRVADFDEKIVNIDNENNRVIIGLINMVYASKENPTLKPAVNGDNRIAVMHFTLDNPSLENFEIKSFSVSAPHHSLMLVFNEWDNGVPLVNDLHPAFEGGTVSLASRAPVAPTPTEFKLSQNVPNPFNPSTQIHFAIKEAGWVNLSIFNVLGQQVTTLVDEYQAADLYSVTWDGTDEHGGSVASGIYFYKISTGNFTDTKKMLLLK